MRILRQLRRPSDRPASYDAATARSAVRSGRLTTAVALACLVTGLTAVVPTEARADDHVPDQQEVRQAQRQVAERATDVAAVRAELAQANQRAELAAVLAARAAEAFNGARHHARLTRRAAAAADRLAGAATADVAHQRDAYADAIGTSYRLAPGLTALVAITRSDGLTMVLDRAATMRNAEDALDGRYDEFRAAATLAEVSADQAELARAEAETSRRAADTARERAQEAARGALDEARAVAERKLVLLADLARLEGISVALAEQRQAALEEAAAQAAAARAADRARAAAAQQALTATPSPTATPTPTADGPPVDPTETPTETPAETPAETPTETPAPEAPADPGPPPAGDPPPVTEPPPPAASGAAAVIAFARAQLGEPYRWGAAGPSAWDCSGLTMMAWREGGRSLPHYSVAQYQSATPVAPTSLQPGDLVFWGSSSNPSSIYHVALYTGSDQIIHAPRAGRPVEETSMYAWTPPTFFARP